VSTKPGSAKYDTFIAKSWYSLLQSTSLYQPRTMTMEQLPKVGTRPYQKRDPSNILGGNQSLLDLVWAILVQAHAFNDGSHLARGMLSQPDARVACQY
jgi:hypothetical protein